MYRLEGGGGGGKDEEDGRGLGESTEGPAQRRTYTREWGEWAPMDEEGYRGQAGGRVL